MKFIVTKTYHANEDEPPCESASRTEMERVLFYTTGEIWYKKMERPWVIEINTLEELVAFRLSLPDVEEIVLGNSDFQEVPNLIEVYNGYRE